MSIVGPRKYLKEIDCGTTVVYRHCPFEPPTEARIKRIDKEHYVVKSTFGATRRAPRPRETTCTPCVSPSTA